MFLVRESWPFETRLSTEGARLECVKKRVKPALRCCVKRSVAKCVGDVEVGGNPPEQATQLGTADST